MPTVADILRAARGLTPTQLSELRREVELIEKESRAIHLEAHSPEDVSCRLVRLTDPEFLDLARRSLAIQGPSLTVYFTLWRHEEAGGLSLPATYLTLKHLSGDSSRHFDDYKYSFSFPFALDVRRDGQAWPYLFEVRNTGGSFDFSLRRVVEARDRRLAEHRLYPPFETELGRDALDRFILRFVGYLTGVWTGIRLQRHQSFVQGVAKNLLVFGYCAGKVFEKEYQREATYRAALRRNEDRVRRELEEGAGTTSRQSIAPTTQRRGLSARSSRRTRR